MKRSIKFFWVTGIILVLIGLLFMVTEEISLYSFIEFKDDLKATNSDYDKMDEEEIKLRYEDYLAENQDKTALVYLTCFILGGGLIAVSAGIFVMDHFGRKSRVNQEFNEYKRINDYKVDKRLYEKYERSQIDLVTLKNIVNRIASANISDTKMKHLERMISSFIEDNAD